MTSAKASEAAPGPTALPIIDVSLLDAPAPDSRARLARQLDRACQDSGFFYVTGHGIPTELIDAVFRQSRALFALPDFAPVMMRYFDAMNRLSARIMTALALALGLPTDHFRAFCEQPLSTLRLLHYPPQPAHASPGEKGCGAHTDFGGITVLLLDEHPGLQIWDHRHRRWLQADPVPGTFVVNLGDMIARWTNDRYRSTLHRVVNLSGAERYSVPFFYSGNPDHEVRCLPNCLAAGEQPRYPATTVERHLIEMYRKTYA
jgi:isopenicillin N synthase-like dioxygenase